MVEIQKRRGGKKRRVGLYLLEDVHDALRAASEDRGVPMSEIVGIVLSDWLENAGHIGASSEKDER